MSTLVCLQCFLCFLLQVFSQCVDRIRGPLQCCSSRASSAEPKNSLECSRSSVTSHPTPESSRKLTNKAVGGRMYPPNLIRPIYPLLACCGTRSREAVIYLPEEKTLMTTQLISRLLGYPKLKHQFPEVQTSPALMLVLTH